jgi:hypothetical protein
MYLFTDNLLGIKKWEKENPCMFITDLEDSDLGVLCWNDGKKNIYYIGSSQGCGCGWRSPDYDFIDMNDGKERLELENRKNDRLDLYTLLQSMDFINSYIIICWEGDQYRDIEETVKLSIAQIKDVDYSFKELTKYLLE